MRAWGLPLKQQAHASASCARLRGTSMCHLLCLTHRLRLPLGTPIPRRYPLAVKLGTITPHGADVYRRVRGGALGALSTGRLVRPGSAGAGHVACTLQARAVPHEVLPCPALPCSALPPPPLFSYAPDENDMVLDPHLARHLAHWGINMMQVGRWAWAGGRTAMPRGGAGGANAATVRVTLPTPCAQAHMRTSRGGIQTKG